ncbi:MAG: hypothetical protein KTR35_20720 [Gammaproteobacteria bacterium]|nr:hypothetical protein [Gammaproteobacteria bacterium]
MKFQLETSDQNLISNYGPGVISVNGTEYRQNLLITAEKVFEHWFDGPLSTLALEHFQPIFDMAPESRPEIIVLGSGENHEFPNMSLLAELQSQGIALEVMNTRAACRTYSVLVSEFRQVAAALIQIPLPN